MLRPTAIIRAYRPGIVQANAHAGSTTGHTRVVRPASRPKYAYAYATENQSSEQTTFDMRNRRGWGRVGGAAAYAPGRAVAPPTRSFLLWRRGDSRNSRPKPPSRRVRPPSRRIVLRWPRTARIRAICAAFAG